MPIELSPDEKYLFEQMCACAQADSWESMTLEELQRLEAAGRKGGEKDLWFRVDNGKGEKLTLREEISKRLEMNQRARSALKGDSGPIEL